MSVTADADNSPGVAELASAALLGALLWEPQRARDVAGWLQPEDFIHPAHRAIYQTIVGLQRDGQPVTLLTLPEQLRRGTYHEMPVDSRGLSDSGLGGPALHTLLAMTPATPSAGSAYNPQAPIESPRSEHVRYARLVLEASIRRQVEAAGTRITAYGRDLLPRQQPELAGRTLEPVLRELIAGLDELGARLAAAEPGGSRIRDALTAAAEPGWRDDPELVALAAGPAATQPGLAAEPPAIFATDGRLIPPGPDEVARAEHAVIGACMSSTTVRDLATSVLNPDDFTRTDAGETFAAISDLHHAGEPVDFVLVAAQLARQPPPPDRPPGQPVGIAPAQLMGLANRFSDVVGGYAAMQVVVRDTIARATRSAGAALHDLATNPAHPTGEVLHDAAATLDRVRGSARRLAGSAPLRALAALTPPAAQVPAARSAPRSSPPTPVAGPRHRPGAAAQPDRQRHR